MIHIFLTQGRTLLLSAEPVLRFLSLSLILGDQIQLPYSKCGPTINLYSFMNMSWLTLLNVHFISPPPPPTHTHRHTDFTFSSALAQGTLDFSSANNCQTILVHIVRYLIIVVANVHDFTLVGIKIYFPVLCPLYQLV